MKTGIYTGGREWKPHEESIFLGVDAEKFHNDVTRYANVTVDSVARAYKATANFVYETAIGKRWYMVAVPFVIALGFGINATLRTAVEMIPSSDNFVQTAPVKKRKKNVLDYMMKYKNVVEQKAQEITGESVTIDDKINAESSRPDNR